MALLFIALILMFVVLHIAQTILAPLTLAIIVGLVFGPLADRVEAIGIPAWISALLTVSLFIAIIAIAIAGFAMPLSEWMDRLPVIWSRLQAELVNWKGPIAAITSLQEQFNEIAGRSSADVTVSVSETSTVTQVAYLAPSLMAQIILFLAGLFFFTATRHQIKESVLAKLTTTSQRKKLVNMFDTIEMQVSTYLLHISGINLLLAAVVTGAMWMIGVPSPILWGLLAGVLNFVIYIGPAMMTLILLAVGLAVSSQLGSIVTPAAVYLLINFIEAQFLTPMLLGKITTINPFAIFLSLIFWIWLWGPVGGFVAVPILMIGYALVKNSPLISSALAPSDRDPNI
ncbi:AI-2E family transporter [Cohaesibacter celericrescens]|uniref:AI-2E family transporter n=1 Tax=Cohaesibacter celericrescens TaxID=2067669 RepID=A0A2N5XT75_9HYPH|nr:AI-2E family transporter [Cohaesibacter celericrescens]